jgi:glycine cleavage system transcriptional repressor
MSGSQQTSLAWTRNDSVTKTIVLTGVGRDRVGIVAELTDLLYQMGCNLLDSSMTLLRGQFAIILMVQLPQGQTLETMEQKLDHLGERMGLTINIRELSHHEYEEAIPKGVPHMISVYGADKPGIVAGITRKLAEMEVNITDVATKFTHEGGDTLFVMILEVMVPDDLPSRAVESSLNDVSKEIGVDVSVQMLEVYDL